MKKSRLKAGTEGSGSNPTSAAKQASQVQQKLASQGRLFIYPAWTGLSRWALPLDDQGMIQTWVQKQPRLRRLIGCALYQLALLADQAQREGRAAQAIDLIDAIYAAYDGTAT